MKRAVLTSLFALVLWPCIATAHDVPDDVKVRIFLKPEGNRMLILVRMPASAMIDILFPTVPGSDWLDLKQIDGFAREGAKVWIADLLSLYEDGSSLPEPQLRAVRVSRATNASFQSFAGALAHVNGPALPSETLLLQDDSVIDTMLETSIRSETSRFSFEPRFARVGVRVTSTVAFLPASGGIRQFEYEGDPATFQLDPTAAQAALGLSRAGFSHYWAETDYLLFFLCVALVFQHMRVLVSFVIAFAVAQFLALFAAFGFMPPSALLPPFWGVLIAATIVYIGIEAIAARDRGHERRGLALAAGFVFGCGFWFGLEPVIQFGGNHRVVSVLAFNAGVLVSYVLALALCAGAVRALVRFSKAPQVAVILAAAVAIHISWHRMLDRAHALRLVPVSPPVISFQTLAVAAITTAAIFGVWMYRWFTTRSAVRRSS